MMTFEIFEFSPSDTARLLAGVGIFILLLLLVISFKSRAKVFCQYLRHMTGIELKPLTVRRVFRESGRGGVRDLLISLLIQEDLADQQRVVTPDSMPDTSIFESDA
jgi:hypothetical protein